MTYPTLKISIKIGIATALAIILFQVSNIFLVYKYFKYDYYITAVAILFLIAGYFISKYKGTGHGQKDTGENLLLNLTNKEISILQLIAEGKSNKEIASLNFVEVSTIKTHINNIYAKLGLRNRREAVNYCRGKLEKL
jgi:DNA-binding CsgD family transcriptional regulator